MCYNTIREREREALQKKGEQKMKFYGAHISKSHGHAVCGKYFNSAVEAWNYAKPSCGYSGAVVAYKGTKIVKRVERA